MTHSGSVSHLLIIVLGAALFPLKAFGEGGDRPKGQKLSKTQTNDHYAPILINNIYNFYSNNGDGSFNPYTSDNEGFEFQKGSMGNLAFEDGIMWGGYWKGILRLGGSNYYHGLQAGKIIIPGTASSLAIADNPALPKYRVYRVRPDITPITTFASVKTLLDSTELRYTQRFLQDITSQQIYDQYIADWNEWPAADGAPYTDVNGNGVYDPTTDIPGVPRADQTLWFIANDLDVTRKITGFDRVGYFGIEMQKTIWAYKKYSLARNTIFTSVKIINKSGFSVDSMFISQWCDNDIGGALGAGDDFVGCDTLRNLGYGYSATNTDGFYGAASPSLGFRLLQGPVVPGQSTDTAFLSGIPRLGLKNLSMTSFNFFVGGGSVYTDPRIMADWYALMNGLITPTNAPYINPITGKVSKYVFSGDPVLGQGWLDGSYSPGDRRLVVTSGPFHFAPGDTQEVVFAAVAGLGSDRLSSINVMKFNSDYAQYAYSTGQLGIFNPPALDVTATELDNEVVLDWSNASQSSAIENYTVAGYRFEGYTVYQLPGPTFENPKVVSVFDLKNGIGRLKDYVFDPLTGTYVQGFAFFGGDYGVKRFADIKVDSLPKGWPYLVNGRTYYYAVTAYYYNPDPGAIPTTFETTPTVLAVVPHSPNPGDALKTSIGKTLTNITKTGLNSGSLSVRVVDPTKITGHQYSVTFDSLNGRVVWQINDATLGTRPVSNNTDYGISNANPVVDGLEIGVTNPDTSWGIKAVYDVSCGNSVNYSPVNLMRTIGYCGAFGVDVSGATSVQDALAKLGSPFTGTSDYEIRFDNVHAGSQFYLSPQVGLTSVLAGDRLPFEVWDITKNQKLIVGIRDANGDGAYSLDTVSALPTWLSNGSSIKHRWDEIYVQDPSSAGYYAEPLPNPASKASAGLVFQKLYIVDKYPPYALLPNPGSVVRLVSLKPIVPGHSFIFSTDSIKQIKNNIDLAKKEISRINVYPNPYFGSSILEPDKYHHWVTFNHLPQRAIIRIFTLAGSHVRTLMKDDPSQFIQWDLTNEAHFAVVPAMYIVHIELPDLGMSKVLKLGVLQEMQVPERAFY